MVNRVNHWMKNIPHDWNIIKLEEHVERITKGTTPSTYGFGFTQAGVNFIKVESIDDQGNFIPNMFSFISEKAHQKLARSQFKAGDLLVTIAGNLGRAAIVNESILPANTNQAVAIVRLSDGSLSKKYIYYYLKGFAIKKYIRMVSTTGAQPNLSLKQVGEFEIALPNLKEQTKIAEILSSVDAAIVKTEAIIEQTEIVKKGLMQQFLAKGIGHTRFKKSEIGEIPEEWEVKPLKDIGMWSGGGTPSKQNEKFWSDEGGIIWVSPKDMYNTEIRTSQDFITQEGLTSKGLRLYDKGTILFVTRSGILRNRVPIALTLEKVTINQDLKALSVNDKCLNEYVYYCLLAQNEKIKNTCVKTGTTVESIDFPSLKDYLIPVPSKKEQKEIVSIIKTYYQKVKNEQESLSVLKRAKLALMQVLLTGKVRFKVDENEVLST
jgi:type I restriction enzyme, S subunit